MSAGQLVLKHLVRAPPIGRRWSRLAGRAPRRFTAVAGGGGVTGTAGGGAGDGGAMVGGGAERRSAGCEQDERNRAQKRARRRSLTLPRRSRSAPSSGSRDRVSRRNVHRSRVWTASLIDPATTWPSELRVTAAISASKRTVMTATERSIAASGITACSIFTSRLSSFRPSFSRCSIAPANVS